MQVWQGTVQLGFQAEHLHYLPTFIVWALMGRTRKTRQSESDPIAVLNACALLLFIHNLLFKVFFEFNLLNKPTFLMHESVLRDGGGVKQGELTNRLNCVWEESDSLQR